MTDLSNPILQTYAILRAGATVCYENSLFLGCCRLVFSAKMGCSFVVCPAYRIHCFENAGSERLDFPDLFRFAVQPETDLSHEFLPLAAIIP